MYLLDASAALAILRNEAGSERVIPLLADSAMSVVNAAETIAVLRRVVDAATALSSFRLLHLPLIPFDSVLLDVFTSGPNERNGLSFGDRACLATARYHRLTAITADRSWLEVAGSDLRIEVIR